MLKAPVAARIPALLENHGVSREDDYYWLRDRDNPEVIAYLEAENAYYDEVMRPLEPLVDELYQEMVARVPDHEEFATIQRGAYFYFWQQDKEQQYPVLARKLCSSRSELAKAPIEIILDLNTLVTAESAGEEEEEYLESESEVASNNGRYLGYLVDNDGSEHYICYIKDLETSELLADRLTEVTGKIAWSADDNYLFYTTLDDQDRSDKLWRHKLGTLQSEDVLILEESDPETYLWIEATQSRRYIIVSTLSAEETSECWIIDAENPLGKPRLLQPRREGVEYYVEHWRDRFIVITNENAPNFKLVSYPENDFSSPTELVPYDERYCLTGTYAFRDGLFITGRYGGLKQIWRLEGNTLKQIAWDEEIYNVEPITNQDYESPEFVVRYESYLTPPSYYGIDTATGRPTLISQREVAGHFNPGDYVQERLQATAIDGTQIPILLRYRKGALDNGPAPVILEGYGSFSLSRDPEFQPIELPILDRGVVLAVAQIRGGGEYGQSWWEDGKMHNKLNTFTDFIAAAQYLFDNGITNSELLAGSGASAGGALICTTANMAGELFKVLVAQVPAVDLLNTLSDPDLPHVMSWRHESGNPELEDDFNYLLSYSPYDNVSHKTYPAMYVTGGLNDSRVSFWEPAKFVAKLRELKTDDNTVVLKTNMGAGHFGSSGSLRYYRDLAEMYAFVLNQLGVR